METSTTVIVWWAGMSCIAVFNIWLLWRARRSYLKKRPGMSAEMIRFRDWQMWLATIYTLGCGFRSVLPRGDIRRIVLVDHWISAIAIGRSVATIAELSFILQLSLMVYEGGKFTKNSTVMQLAKLPFPMIVIAELFSWYACTTGNFKGTVIEESIWAVAATIILACLLLLHGHYVSKQLNFIRASILGLLGYITYMVTVDVPTYIRKFAADTADGKVYSTVREGLVEVATEWTYTRAHADWQYEFVWMTLYFSLAVWVSISMITAPHLDKNIKRGS